jgi:hypothetical protein
VPELTRHRHHADEGGKQRAERAVADELPLVLGQREIRLAATAEPPGDHAEQDQREQTGA